MKNRPESKHLRKFRERHMLPGETIVEWGDGYIGSMMGKDADTQKNGSLIVSSERVIFYRRGLLGEVLETIPLKSITSIERRSTLGHRTVRIHTSHDKLEFKLFDKEIEQSLVRAIDDGRSLASTDTSNTAATSDISALEALARLRDAGVLTEQEFQEKKKEILSRL